MKRQKMALIMAVLTALVFIGVVVWTVMFGVQDLVPTNITSAVASAQSGMRTTIVALAAGIVAVAGLFYTDQTLRHTRARDREQADLTQQAQVIDRYAAAITHLASDKPTEQLGGVYFLEGISRASKVEHATVVKILAGFVRERAPRNEKLSEESDSDVRPPTAVQAALTVLSRRPDGYTQPLRVDLSHADLRGADLSSADLPFANLRHADLRNADLGSAKIPTADLRYSDLRGADLEAAYLQVARLTNAKLENAWLEYADLTSADLSETDLTKAQGLTVEQLVQARPWLSTALPKELGNSPEVAVRIAHVEAEEAAWQAEAKTGS
jgi:hypothetical protein